MKRWDIAGQIVAQGSELGAEDLIKSILENRGLKTKKDVEAFLHPKNPFGLKPKDVGIDASALQAAIVRIKKAVKGKESIVVYADYDADGITAGAIMWETLHSMGANVMPYIPHRAEEGYGLSVKGIDAVRERYDPSLIITVDHGITGWEKVAYAKSLGIEVIVTDHHVRPEKLPDAIIVHTTSLCGAGVSWFVSKELSQAQEDELLVLATIGTIADLVPLVGPNRSIVKYGLAAINKTKRIGLTALIESAGITKGEIGTYDISHVVAPRINAMGRLVHGMDALRLLCTRSEEKARLLAEQLGLTNKERQQMTMESATHAKDVVLKRQNDGVERNLLFVASEQYNQGIIGLVAGRLVEEYYKPAIVVAIGEEFSKASARSINGFNIVEAIRTCADILVDVGGHPMAAGFTVKTSKLDELQARLEELAGRELSGENLQRVLRIDAEITLRAVSTSLWKAIQGLMPFGFGNPEPVFATRGVYVDDARTVGAEGKHLKLRLTSHVSDSPAGDAGSTLDAIAFNMGEFYPKLRPDVPVDVAYTVDMNVWNGNKKLQLKVKDIAFPQ